MNNQLTLFDRDSDYLESSVKDFDSKTASFRVHASLIYKLGESLIADEITALSELIKNAYFSYFPCLLFSSSGLPSPFPSSISRFASAISAFISTISTFSFSSHSSRV